METYEMLRPGRAKSVKTLKEHAEMLRTKYKANRIAELIDEAAEIYEARGILSKRY